MITKPNKLMYKNEIFLVKIMHTNTFHKRCESERNRSFVIVWKKAWTTTLNAYEHQFGVTCDTTRWNNRVENRPPPSTEASRNCTSAISPVVLLTHPQQLASQLWHKLLVKLAEWRWYMKVGQRHGNGKFQPASTSNQRLHAEGLLLSLALHPLCSSPSKEATSVQATVNSAKQWCYN